MNALLAIFAAPSAVATVDAFGGAFAATTRPFAEVLGALRRDEDRPKAADHGDERYDRVAERLQEILQAADLEAGDCATVCFDPVDGRIEVDHGSPLAADVEAAIAADVQLMEDLRQMAEIDAASNERLELLVQVA